MVEQVTLFKSFAETTCRKTGFSTCSLPHAVTPDCCRILFSFPLDCTETFHFVLSFQGLEKEPGEEHLKQQLIQALQEVTYSPASRGCGGW